MTYIKSNDKKAIIGNEYIEKSFFIENGQLLPDTITNKRLNEPALFVVGKGSEEFSVTFLKKFGKFELKASMLTIDKINSYEKSDSSILEFVFKPAIYRNTTLNFRLVYKLKNDDFFMKKQLCFSASGDLNLRIDTVDTELLVLADGIKQKWTHPEMDKAFIDGFHASLGQPVYINGMFTGSEFPMNDNNIVENTLRLRYYSGKSIASILNGKKEHSFHKSVFGSAQTMSFDVIRADFLEYIKTVSQKTYLRTQYNSWYDHMLNITEENITGSFYQIEKGLTQNFVKPLDAYVVDDGWNDYKSDFWCFNDKFPHELYNSSRLANNFSSHFGLWLGPRGGYNFNKSFGKRMQRHGKGGYNRRSYDICIADEKYVRNVELLFLDYMNRFDIDYWKLDGFMLKTCRSKRHGHPTGGYKDMYVMTDAWEKWIDIFRDMRKFRAEQGKELWINLTCYAVPSPWFLRYVNSVWMQNSADIGFTDKSVSGEELNGKDFDRMLTYRDALYYDFHRVRQYQFPNSNMYNHEPIYGHTAKVKMTDDEYRKYMYMISSRGTAFWELYYSFDLFNDNMWRINADVLRFVRENFETLRNSKLIGESADSGKIYGYSAWNGKEGIISLRNPSDKPQKFSVKLEKEIGVNEDVKGLTRINVIPYETEKCDIKYSYGDTLSVELGAHEIVIYKFGGEKTTAPVLKRAKFEDEHTAVFSFDRHIVLDENSFTYMGKPIKAELLANYSEVLLHFDNAQAGSKYTVDYSVRDLYGNKLTSKKTLACYKDNLLFSDREAPCEIEDDFTLTMTVNTATKETLLFSQGNSLAVSLINGNVRFNCCSLKCVGHADICNTGDRKITLVREKNAMIKIYIDGVLDGSYYDERVGNMTVPKAEIKLSNSIKGFTVLNKALAFDEV